MSLPTHHTRTDRVRALLDAHGPLSKKQLRALLSREVDSLGRPREVTCQQIASTVGAMERDGMLLREGDVYRLGRPPLDLSEEAKKARRKARQDRYEAKRPPKKRARSQAVMLATHKGDAATAAFKADQAARLAPAPRMRKRGKGPGLQVTPVGTTYPSVRADGAPAKACLPGRGFGTLGPSSNDALPDSQAFVDAHRHDPRRVQVLGNGEGLPKERQFKHITPRAA